MRYLHIDGWSIYHSVPGDRDSSLRATGIGRVALIEVRGCELQLVLLVLPARVLLSPARWGVDLARNSTQPRPM